MTSTIDESSTKNLVSSRVAMFETHWKRVQFNNSSNEHVESVKSNPRKPGNHRIKGYFRKDSFVPSNEGSLEVAKPESREDIDTGRKPPEEIIPPLNYTGHSNNKAGLKLYVGGDYPGALQMFCAALHRQRLFGGGPAAEAITLSNIGVTHIQLGNIKQAEKALLESLEKKKLAPTVPTWDTATNLGALASGRGDVHVANNYYRVALKDLRSRKGLRSSMADTLYNIGRIEVQQGQWDVAMEILGEAWSVIRDVYGEDHLYIAETLELLGFVQIQINETEAAMLSFSAALAIYRKIHGAMHKSVANLLYNIGMVREKSGEMNGAWDAYRTSRDLYLRLGVPASDMAVKIVKSSVLRVEKAMIVEKMNQVSSNGTVVNKVSGKSVKRKGRDRKVSV